MNEADRFECVLRPENGGITFTGKAAQILAANARIGFSGEAEFPWFRGN
jgi:hypothetical protein